jgi:hypothetical protein
LQYQQIAFDIHVNFSSHVAAGSRRDAINWNPVEQEDPACRVAQDRQHGNPLARANRFV